MNTQGDCRRAIPYACRVPCQAFYDSGQPIISPELPACLFFHSLPRLCGFSSFRFRVPIKPVVDVCLTVKYAAPNWYAGEIVDAIKSSAADTQGSSRILTGQYRAGYLRGNSGNCLIVHSHFSYAVLVKDFSRYKRMIFNRRGYVMLKIYLQNFHNFHSVPLCPYCPVFIHFLKQNLYSFQPA
jgi:hypothetical protein